MQQSHRMCSFQTHRCYIALFQWASPQLPHMEPEQPQPRSKHTEHTTHAQTGTKRRGSGSSAQTQLHKPAIGSSYRFHHTANIIESILIDVCSPQTVEMRHKNTRKLLTLAHRNAKPVFKHEKLTRSPKTVSHTSDKTHSTLGKNNNTATAADYAQHCPNNILSSARIFHMHFQRTDRGSRASYFQQTAISE